jgi:hypothetical protein
MKMNVLNKIILNYINFGGIGFTVNSDILIEKNVGYNMKITVILQTPIFERDFITATIKISTIGITKISQNCYSCRAVFRELTDEQILNLKKIARKLNSKSFNKMNLIVNIAVP